MISVTGPFFQGGLFMPHPTPRPLRQVVQLRARQGESPAAIAAALGLAPRTVRHLLQRFRDGGPEAIAPSYLYRNPQSQQRPDFCDEALQLRREHSTWGAGLILVFLRRL